VRSLPTSPRSSTRRSREISECLRSRQDAAYDKRRCRNRCRPTLTNRYAKKTRPAVTNSNNPDDIAVAATRGCADTVAGSIIDRSFKAPTRFEPDTVRTQCASWRRSWPADASFCRSSRLQCAQIDPNLDLSFVTGNPAGVRAKLSGNPPSINRPLGDTGFELGFAGRPTRFSQHRRFPSIALRPSKWTTPVSNGG